MRLNTECPNCMSGELSIFYEQENVPVNSVILLSTRKESEEFPKGDIALGYCRYCGFISNVAFNSQLLEYSSRYEATQGFSETFNAYHRDLASRIIERYSIHDKDIIEIGCGQGEFLNLLCELGKNRGIGFDPVYNEKRQTSDVNNEVSFIKDFYSEKYAHFRADFVCCKMTLEHIPNTASFVRMIRRSIGDSPNTIVFFQVPDVTRILNEQAFWDIYYEHCSYFSPISLAHLFRSCGFNDIDVNSEYGNQYLTIEASIGEEFDNKQVRIEDDLETINDSLDLFNHSYPNKIRMWQDKIKEIKHNGQSAVIWGGGSKAVAFLSTLKLRTEIEYVVDINPNKHDTYLPGTGQKVVSPEFLIQYQPDVIVVMNPIYTDEIQQELNQMKIRSKLIKV